MLLSTQRAPSFPGSGIICFGCDVSVAEEGDLKGLPGDLLTSPAHLAPRWPKMYPCAPAVTCPFNVRTRTFNTNFIHTRALCSRVETAPRALSQPPLSARTTIRVEPLSVCLGHPSAHFAGYGPRSRAIGRQVVLVVRQTLRGLLTYRDYVRGTPLLVHSAQPRVLSDEHSPNA